MIEVRLQQIDELKKQLSPSKVALAQKMAINDAARFGKTRVKDAIRQVYNIKSSRITDANPKKGLSIRFANTNDLTAEIRGGHIPANFASFTGVRMISKEVGREIVFYSSLKTRKTKVKRGKAIKKQYLSVEIKKGNRETLFSAFRLGATKGMKGAQGGGTNVIFARGRRGKPTFEFGKKRMPIASLASLSVHTAATNTNAIQLYQPAVNEKLAERMLHHLKRLMPSGGTSL